MAKTTKRTSQPRMSQTFKLGAPQTVKVRSFVGPIDVTLLKKAIANGDAECGDGVVHDFHSPRDSYHFTLVWSMDEDYDQEVWVVPQN